MAFEPKPAFEDVAANSYLTGLAPRICIPLIDAAADAGLDNIGSEGSTYDVSYSSDTNPISYNVLEGGGVDLDIADEQVLAMPPPADSVTRANGTMHWRLKLPATMPVDAEYFYFASSGIATTGGSGLGAYNLRVTATAVVLAFRSSDDSSEVEYAVTHVASGAEANGIIDVHFKWGSGGVHLFVNGVASGDNDPDNNGFLQIHDAAAGGTGEDFGYIALFTPSLEPTIVVLGWNHWGGQLSQAQIDSHIEDPHWVMRQRAPFNTLRPPISINADESEVRIAFTRTADAPDMTMSLNAVMGWAADPVVIASSSDPTRFVLECARTDTENLRALTFAYQFHNDGATDYPLLDSAILTGKTNGSAVTISPPTLTGDILVGVIPDLHRNKPATFSDAFGDAGGLAGTGIAPTDQTEAEYDVAVDSVDLGLVSKSPQLIIDIGDSIQGGANYTTNQAQSDALSRVLVNKRCANTGGIPVVEVVGNHEGYNLSDPDGAIRRASRLSHQVNPEGHASAQTENWGPFSIDNGDIKVGFFILDLYSVDTTVADQVTAIDTWAESFDGDYMVVVAHGMHGGGGNRGGLGAMNSTLQSIITARGINAYIYGHDHRAVSQMLGDCIVAQAPGVPWHISTDLTASSYNPRKFAQAMWGFLLLRFSATGMTVEFWQTGKQTLGAPGDEEIFDEPRLVFTAPSGVSGTGFALGFAG